MRAGALGIAAALWLAAAPARADIRDVAARVAEQWGKSGAAVTRLPSRFLFDEETMGIVIPPGKDRECIEVALIGPRGMSFHAKAAEEDDSDDGGQKSVAGALVITRCAAGPIHRVQVGNDAGRGAVETVIARSDGPLPSIVSILPERIGTAQPVVPEPGDLPALPTSTARADAAEGRARRDGGAIAARDSWTAGDDGTGSGRVLLTPGCHLVELFAEDPRTAQPRRRGKIDLDGELHTEQGDRIMARDRSDAPDVRLETCVGEVTGTVVSFVGSPSGAPVTVTHASWPIPGHLPQTWGPEVRARMASALLARHVTAPSRDPVFVAQGAAGTASVPVAIEPGGCYLVVAAVDGTAHGLTLRANAGGRESVEDRASSEQGGVLGFCAQEARRARLVIEARGTTAAWALAVFRVQGGVWGDQR